jgi:hypothetical protein
MDVAPNAHPERRGCRVLFCGKCAGRARRRAREEAERKKYDAELDAEVEELLE